jgi:hypothetical protein
MDKDYDKSGLNPYFKLCKSLLFSASSVQMILHLSHGFTLTKAHDKGGFIIIS